MSKTPCLRFNHILHWESAVNRRLSLSQAVIPPVLVKVCFEDGRRAPFSKKVVSKYPRERANSADLPDNEKRRSNN